MAASEVALTLAQRLELQFEVEQFLFLEAELLDQRRYDDWLALCAQDIEYTAPVRITREGNDDVGGPDDLHLFDDDHMQLSLRVAGVQVKSAWAEIPPSRTRRLLTNVMVEPPEGDELCVRSNFLVYRTRSESVEHLFAGQRRDLLRRAAAVPGGFQIARREIIFDRVAFPTDNISILF